MRFQLIEQLPTPRPGHATELSALECAASDTPVIAIADQRGLNRLASIGIDPVATVTPSKRSKWRTTRVLERTFKRVGATTVVCRSDWCLQTAGVISGVDPILPESHGPVRLPSREALREKLGLSPEHRFVVPLTNHPGEVDAMSLTLCSLAMSIAQTPIVLLMPANAAHVNRARAFLAGADRVLDLIPTSAPAAAYTPAADALIWGPHKQGADALANADHSVRWARTFGVPLLCPHEIARLARKDESLAPLYPCNGTSAADIASPLRSIFKPDES